MAKVYFVFGIHNHQPVGNFPSVFEEAYDKCYYPFLQVLQKYPAVKCNVHISGPLYDWIGENRKEFMAMLKSMAKHGQIEVVSGGYYEPILQLIPDEDKLDQIEKMNGFINKNFGQTPRGIWVTERVWEPFLARIINQAGLEYAFLDDTHFRYAGLNEKEFFGYYLTEDNYQPVKVFPISKTLRYKIPFSQSFEAVNLLKSFHNPEKDVLITLFDDGEKFGLWPHTFDWVYNKGWLEKFFAQLSESKDIVETITAGEAARRFTANGLVYLPTASYEEMGEWVLEPDSEKTYRALKDHIGGHPQQDTFLNFVRGGFFRNFYTKYDRLNYMHKRMLQVSRTIRSKAKPSGDKKIFDFLWKAQCNCGYWHGIFGGFYLGHIRSAIFENLIRAEAAFDKKYADCEINAEACDIDLDGNQEIILKNKKLTCVFSPQGGTLVEMSLRDTGFNYLNTVTRREESYHHKIREKVGASARKAATIHEIVQCKDKGLDRFLVYDSYERRALVDHVLNKDISLADFNAQRKFRPLFNTVYSCAVKKGKEDIRLGYEYREYQLAFSKDIVFGKKSGFETVYEFRDNHLLKYHDFGVEFNLFLQSPKDIMVDGHPLSLDEGYVLENVSQFEIRDLFKKTRICFSCDESDIWIMPVYSVSSSEGGFEKGYQEISVLFINRVHKDRYSLSCFFKKEV